LLAPDRKYNSEGFLKAVKSKHNEDSARSVNPNDLLALLQSFSFREFLKIISPLLVLYRDDDPNDQHLVLNNLEQHAYELYEIIGKLRL